MAFPLSFDIAAPAPGGPGSCPSCGHACHADAECTGGVCLAPRESLACARLHAGLGVSSPACSTALECEAGQVCDVLPCASAPAQKYCLPRCNGDEDCPIDYACDNGSCVASGATCTSASCPPPYFQCTGSTCAPQACTSDTDCGATDGGTCVASACYARSGICTAL